MTVPWVVLATTAVARCRSCREGGATGRRIWFPWSWAVGNLAMFCFWSVAKPNYFLPCLPGVALLVGIEWVRLTRAARDPESRTHRGPAVACSRTGSSCSWRRRSLPWWRSGWLRRILAGDRGLLGRGRSSRVVASAWAWRRGADAGALAPLVGAWAVGVVVVYGAVAPARTPSAATAAWPPRSTGSCPPSARTVMFFHELDEGLWFYLHDRNLVPVPGSQPRYNEGFDLDPNTAADTSSSTPPSALESEKQILVEWLDPPRAALAVRPDPQEALRPRSPPPSPAGPRRSTRGGARSATSWSCFGQRAWPGCGSSEVDWQTLRPCLETNSIPGFFFNTGYLPPTWTLPDGGQCVDLDVDRNPFSPKKTGFGKDRDLHRVRVERPLAARSARRGRSPL